LPFVEVPDAIALPTTGTAGHLPRVTFSPAYANPGFTFATMGARSRVR
jgi:hypothetical protein